MPVAASVVSGRPGRSSLPAKPCSGENSAATSTPACAHQVDIAPALAVHAGLVGDQADALALERLEVLRRQHVEAGERCAVAADFAAHAGAGERLVVPVSVTPGASMPSAAATMVATLAAQRRERRPRVGVHAVGQQDDVALGRRVDPDGSAGEAGVAVGADGEQLAAVAGVGRVDVPAEAAQDGLVGRGLRLGELLHRERAEEADAVAARRR